MASVNKVILVGNSCADTELRYAGETPTCTINMATNEQWKDKSGQKQERTEFHRVVFFGRQAEVAAQYVTKGKQIYVEGSLRTRKWTDKEGVEKYTTEIIADRMQLLGGGEGRQGAGEERDRGSQAPRRDSTPAARQNGQRPPRQPAPAGDFSDFDSDLPF